MERGGRSETDAKRKEEILREMAHRNDGNDEKRQGGQASERANDRESEAGRGCKQRATREMGGRDMEKRGVLLGALGDERQSLPCSATCTPWLLLVFLFAPMYSVQQKNDEEGDLVNRTYR